MLRRILSGLILASLFFIPTGCIAVGSNAKLENPTLGKELMDLKIAYEEDCISKEEYERAKSRLLEDCD